MLLQLVQQPLELRGDRRIAPPPEGILDQLQDVEELLVEGAYELEPCGSEPQGPPRRIVKCTEWARGPGASLRCGLTALDADVEAAVIVLADGPSLSPQAVERVVTAWRESGDIVAASYDGERGHPLVLGRTDWGGIPDEGLRVRRARLVPCDDLGAPGDVDRPEDLESL